MVVTRWTIACDSCWKLSRPAVGEAFSIAVNLNSTDQLEGGLSNKDVLQVVRALADQALIDFLDISGGKTTLDPAFIREM